MADPAEIEREVAQMAEYWGERREGWRDAAADEFERIVMPACLYGPEQDFRRLQMVNMCFTEWVLFERQLREGKTPLQLYVETPPEGTSEFTVDHLRQIDETQFFARFAILDKDPETSRAMLLDVGTDRRYEVCDGALCKNTRWRNGTIAERIACVDGLWQVVGQVHLYDRADPDATRVDGPGALHPDDLRAEDMRDAGLFLRLVRDVLGVDGRYAPTLSMVSVEGDAR